MLVFLALAYGLAWLVALPLWLSDGLGNPLFGVLAIAIMATPAIAALVVVRFVERPVSIPHALGLATYRPLGRFFFFLALGLILPVLLVLAALAVGAFLGLYPADVTNFSAFRAVVALNDPTGTVLETVPIGALVAAQFLSVLAGALINVVPALGEELGWRGWLLPRLLPYGMIPALVVSGAAWGLWHAPLILLGYNYPFAPGWLGLLAMVGTTMVLGTIFAWMRLRSNSVWPAALAHGSLNAAAGFSVVFAAGGERIDTVNATILGWSGWLVPLVVIAVLFATGQFRGRAYDPVLAVGPRAGAGAA
ncbi:CPBP family intramembrane glutamic endopeptidase [Planctomonas psychrotolerans]|uniref:CPBP family intramembrane glutamic endopeptidase n=1 Tax=Planctomonas psychrotolerans TaxID=2528712 RepID=UPI001D0D0CDB|nr:type II CAAX endopeptidase family protein [Planctomonas psychrotolerans]